jgi:hypothetical protein
MGMNGEKLIAAVVLAALVTGAAGCEASGTEAVGQAAARPQGSRSGGALQAAGTVSAAAAPAIVPATTHAGQSRPAASSSPTAAQGQDVYLAEGQDVHGTIVRAPACASGCPLSGDGTIVLYGMTWHEWTGAQAVGTGSEDIQGCVPNCASGRQYKVAVTVTLAAPKKDCATPGSTQYVWTRASFRWPGGLPSGLRGSSAPYNPWTFTALESQLGCR